MKNNKNFTERVHVGEFKNPASIYKILLDKGLISQPKMQEGGDLLKSLAPTLVGGLTSLIPGGAAFAPLTSSLTGTLLSSMGSNEEIPTPLNNTTNPYGMRNGGNVVGFKQYDTLPHEMGGQTINENGVPTNNLNAAVEIEKQENAYKYSVLPGSEGSTYVFSDVNKTADMVKKIIKEYNKNSNNKSDLDFPTRTAMEFDIKSAENRNELINQAKQVTTEDVVARYGKKMPNGGYLAIAQMLQNVIPQLGNQTDNTQLTTDNPVTLGKQLTPDFVTPSENLGATLPPSNLTQASEPNSGFKFGNLFNKENLPKLLRTAGLVGGVVDAFQPAQKEQALLPDFSASDRNIAQLSADLTGAEQAAVQNFNMASNLNRSASSSFNQYRNRQLQSLENYNDQLMDISMEEQAVRNNILSGTAQYNLNKAVTTRNILDENNQRNLQNKDRSQDFRRLALSDIVGEADRLSTQNVQERFATAKTEEAKAILSTIANAPNFRLNDNFIKNIQAVAKGDKDVSELTNEELILFNKLN